MSVEEGLKSTDVEIIKAARGAAKGKVSKYVKALDKALFRDEEVFRLDEIDESRVETVYDNLNDEFQELYDRYHQYASINASTAALIKEFEEKYLSEVDTAVLDVSMLYAKYRKAKKLSEEKERFKVKEKSVETAVNSLKNALKIKIETAKAVLTSENENVKKTSRTVKNEF